MTERQVLDQVKAAQRIFAHDRHPVEYDIPAKNRREMRARTLDEIRRGGLVGQGEVRPELFEDVGIAPAVEQCRLPCRQAPGPTARKFLLGRSRAERIEAGHCGGGDFGDAFRACRAQRAEIAEALGLEVSQIDRPQPREEALGGVTHVSDSAPSGEAERWFQSRMKPVAARAGRLDLWVGDRDSAAKVPAKPLRAEPAERAIRRPIDRDPFPFHSRFPSKEPAP